jgi:hypothetical protein
MMDHPTEEEQQQYEEMKKHPEELAKMEIEAIIDMLKGEMT